MSFRSNYKIRLIIFSLYQITELTTFIMQINGLIRTQNSESST